MNLAWGGFCRKSKGRDFMEQTFDMTKLGVGNEEEWKRVFPILFAQANEVLKWKLGLSESADDIAQESLVDVIRSFKFKEEKKSQDLIRFTRTVAFRKGVDWLRKTNAEKRGWGGVLSLDEKIGDDGKTRLDRIASCLDEVDSHEMCDIMNAIGNCRKESLSAKEGQIFHAFYILGKSQSEISENENVPLGSIGTTLKRSLEKLKSCLKGKGFDNPFDQRESA